MSEPWHKFKLDNDKPIDTDDSHKTLTHLYHVTHIENALQVVRDGKIKAGLVYDESQLNTERILVTWLSPNDWTNAGGFRYGNIRLEFSIDLVFDFESPFWVEWMNYHPPACRILLANNDSYEENLIKYIPYYESGPWEYVPPDGPHKWNGNICLEFMLEKSLLLSQINGIDFVKHHERRCNIDPHSCADRGMEPNEAGAKFISAIISQDLKPQWPEMAIRDGGTLKHSWQIAWDKIVIKIKASNCRGNLTQNDPASRAFARAFFSAFYLNKAGEMDNICTVFASASDMISVMAEMFYDTFHTRIP